MHVFFSLSPKKTNNLLFLGSELVDVKGRVEGREAASGALLRHQPVRPRAGLQRIALDQRPVREGQRAEGSSRSRLLDIQQTNREKTQQASSPTLRRPASKPRASRAGRWASMSSGASPTTRAWRRAKKAKTAALSAALATSMEASSTGSSSRGSACSSAPQHARRAASPTSLRCARSACSFTSCTENSTPLVVYQLLFHRSVFSPPHLERLAAERSGLGNADGGGGKRGLRLVQELSSASFVDQRVGAGLAASGSQPDPAPVELERGGAGFARLCLAGKAQRRGGRGTGGHEHAVELAGRLGQAGGAAAHTSFAERHHGIAHHQLKAAERAKIRHDDLQVQLAGPRNHRLLSRLIKGDGHERVHLAQLDKSLSESQRLSNQS